jgi:hypothetical protein
MVSLIGGKLQEKFKDTKWVIGEQTIKYPEEKGQKDKQHRNLKFEQHKLH